MPGVKQACPTVAACWSPAMPRMRIAPPNSAGVGRAEIGRRNRAPRQQRRRHAEQRRSSPSSQAPRWMSNSSVRAALVASVACTLPPVSRQSRKLSIVPKASSPRSAAARAPVDMVEQPGDLGGRRNRDRAAARSVARSRGSWPARSAARRRHRRCGGPARRWRCGSACRWRGPRSPWSRAGW